MIFRPLADLHKLCLSFHIVDPRDSVSSITVAVASNTSCCGTYVLSLRKVDA